VSATPPPPVLRPRKALPGVGAVLRRPVVALAGLVVLTTWLVQRYAVLVHTWQNDETLTIFGARFVQPHLPAGLWDPSLPFQRGLERLTADLLAVLFAIVPSTAQEFRLGHLLVAFLFALTAVPTYLLAREVRVGPGWALGAAALAVLAPWAVLGTTFVNSSAGYVTITFALWTYLRTALRPGPGADVLAVAATVLMVMARVGNAGLAVALPVVVLVLAWRERPGEGLRRDALTLPGRILRTHPVLVAVGVVVVLVVVVGGAQRFTGEYPILLDLPWAALWLNLRVGATQIGEGLGIVPFVLAVPWLAVTLVRPRSREAGAFAVVAVAAIVALLYVNHFAGREERYLLPVVPLLSVAAVVALARREVHVVGVVVTGLLLARAVVTVGLVGDLGPFGHWFAPAGTFFQKIWVFRTADTLPLLSRGLAPTVVVLAAVAVAAVCVAVDRRALRVGLLVAVVGLGAVSAVYNLHKYTRATNAAFSFREQAFADRLTGGGTAAAVDVLTPTINARPTWTEVEYFNASMRSTLTFDDAFSYACCVGLRGAQSLHVDPLRGTFTENTGQGIPPWLLTIAQATPAGFVTRVVGVSTQTVPPVRVERVVAPARIAWAVRHADRDGYPDAGRRPVARVFPAARAVAGPNACLDATMVARGPDPGPHRFRLVTAGRPAVTGQATAGKATLARVPVGALARPVDVALHGPATVGMADLRVVPCR
jgi:hypothetical protein